MLDLLWPIGLMFSLIGALLVLFGASTNSNKAMYANSLSININLNWGVVLLIFGILMILGAVMGKKEK
jgi:hypothetical protein